jgi:hypothetical protein
LIDNKINPCILIDHILKVNSWKFETFLKNLTIKENKQGLLNKINWNIDLSILDGKVLFIKNIN